MTPRSSHILLLAIVIVSACAHKQPAPPPPPPPPPPVAAPAPVEQGPPARADEGKAAEPGPAEYTPTPRPECTVVADCASRGKPSKGKAWACNAEGKCFEETTSATKKSVGKRR